MYNENSNYEAWAKLDEAMFTSSQIKQSEREAGETDMENIYPVSLAETRKMERLLNEAIEVADDPNDPDFRERHNRLSEVVAWSLERNRTWRWQIILGTIIAACIVYYFNTQDKERAQEAKANVESVQQWTPQDTTLVYAKLPKSGYIDNYYASANKYKLYQLAHYKSLIESAAANIDYYKQKADTCTDAKKKQALEKNMAACKENMAKDQEAYKRYEKMTYAELKEDALAQAKASVESRESSRRTTLAWLAFLIVVIPLYIITGYPRGYVLTRHKTQDKILSFVRKAGFSIAAFFFGAGVAMALLPDMVVERRYASGRTERTTEGNMANIIVLGIKAALIVVGVVIFSFVSVLIISVETCSRLVDVIRDRGKARA